MLSLCLHFSSLNIYHLIFAVDVILWFRLFINSVLAYVHVLHIYCLIISLNLYFVNWGFKRSRCFIHYLNIHFPSSVSFFIGPQKFHFVSFFIGFDLLLVSFYFNFHLKILNGRCKIWYWCCWNTIKKKREKLTSLT